MGRKVGSEEADRVLAEGDVGSGKGSPEMGETFWLVSIRNRSKHQIDGDLTNDSEGECARAPLVYIERYLTHEEYLLHRPHCSRIVRHPFQEHLQTSRAVNSLKMVRVSFHINILILKRFLRIRKMVGLQYNNLSKPSNNTRKHVYGKTF